MQPADDPAQTRRKITIVPAPASASSSSWPMGKLALLCLIGVGGYAGYYGYCSYQAGARLHAFAGQSQGLRQALLAANKHVGADDVRRAVVEFAARSRVEVARPSIRVSIMPLDAENLRRLPRNVEMAMGIMQRLPKKGDRQQLWIVGFKAQLSATHGPATRVGAHERYTYFEWVDAAASSGQ